MFYDSTYQDRFENYELYYDWKRGVDKILRECPDKKLVVIECGAGITVRSDRLKKLKML